MPRQWIENKIAGKKERVYAGQASAMLFYT